MRSGKDNGKSSTNVRKSSSILGFGDDENLGSENSFVLDINQHGQMILEALSIHDRTLWLHKLNDAVSQFNERNEQHKNGNSGKKIINF